MIFSCRKNKESKAKLQWLLAAVFFLIAMLSWFPVAQAATHCGRLWNTIIEVDWAYLDAAPQYIHNEDGTIKSNPGCDDQIYSIYFNVEWPSMAPSPRGTEYLWNRRPDGFVIGLSSIGNRDGKARDRSRLLYSWLGNHSGGGEKWTAEEVMEQREWQEDLGLYYAYPTQGKNPNVTNHVYWTVRSDNTVDVLIECSALGHNPARSFCTYLRDLPQYDATLKLSFLMVNLPDWKDMEQKSMILLESFIRH